MKTLWILDHHSSEPEHNGIARHYDFAKELANQGVNVVVIASSYSHFNHKYFKHEEYSVSEINLNARLIYLRTKPAYINNGKNRFLNMISYVQMVRKFQNKISKDYGKPDAILGCSIHPLTWVAAYRSSKKFKSKFFIEVRDFWPLVFLESNQYNKWHPVVIFFSMLEKWAYKKANKIIVSLPFADRYITDKLGFSREKIQWIGQPMDYDRFDKYAVANEKLIPKEIRDFIKESFICVFTGYYKEYEGVFTMLEAAKILKDQGEDIKMIFVGNGSAKEEMESFVEKNNLDNVLVSSRIDKVAIPALLKKSNIKMATLSFDNEDAFSYGISKNKINEYLYSGGCTLFGFAHPNSAVELSGGGYVIPPDNPQLFADTISKVIKMSEYEFNCMSKKARQYIKDEHGLDILAKKMEKTLLE